MNLNKVMIAGNLTRDPELKYTPKGTAVCRVGLALNRTWKTETGEKKEEVTFIDVGLFGRAAETVAQYLKKGSAAFFEGRMKLDTWDDKQTGQKRSKLGVIADSFQFIGGKKDKATEAPAAQPQAGIREGSQWGKVDGQADQTAPPAPDDDVPF
jgi:single-strand DNA-binding protein